jgi:hypothetical protein
LCDDGPCETEIYSSEARLNINKNLEVFVVVTVVQSLLLIVIQNRMHTVKIVWSYLKIGNIMRWVRERMMKKSERSKIRNLLVRRRNQEK